MKKVSFDFDDTLTNEHIQNYVINLMKNGYDIHIVTSRPPDGPDKWFIDGKPAMIWDNYDLFQLIEILGIKKENIHFLDYSPKYLFFKDNEDFIFHIDDDHIEVEEINYFTDVKGVLFDGNWKENCDRLI